MAKQKTQTDSGLTVDGDILANPVKVRRVIEGVVTREGKLEGGLGADADPALIRAHYDKLGGLILRGGKKIKIGAFWDFKLNRPRATPDVVFEHRSASGELFEYKGEEPVEVKAEKATRARKEKVDKGKPDDEVDE